MLDCMLSMRWERRLEASLRRPSLAEGSSGPEEGYWALFSFDVEASDEDMGGLGFVSSAKCRLCERNWHFKHIDPRIKDLVGSCRKDVGELITLTELYIGRAVCLSTGCMAKVPQGREQWRFYSPSITNGFCRRFELFHIAD